MSTTTLTTPAAITFKDYAGMHSDETLIFAAHALSGQPDHATGSKYWAIIGVLSERHPGAMEKALTTARPHQSAIEILVPHISS